LTDSAYRQRLQQYLASGDPILMAEAQRILARESPLSLEEQVLEEQVQALAAQVQGPQMPNSQRQLYPAIANSSPNNSPPNKAQLDCAYLDCSELLAQIGIHRRRLGWGVERVQAILKQLFGKADQARLTDEELVTWLRWLQQQF
jgi:hypothetical protein